MKTVGIIAEFNPFHNGHEYLIREAMRITGADKCVVVMSGNFVQRGAPASCPKHDRARCALLGGADLVLELPISYSTASAEAFAYGAVSVLNSLGTIDYLAFGSECGDTNVLNMIAEELLTPSAEFENNLRKALQSGMSYPAARMNALPEFADILKGPNNILGIEYIKALKRLDSHISPVCVRRKESDHSSDALRGGYSSATAIRSSWEKGNIQVLTDELPSCTSSYINENTGITCPITMSDMDEIMHYMLLSSDSSDLCGYQDMTADLSNKIYRHLGEYTSLDAFISLLNSKELTYTRISRALLHALLKLPDMTRDASGVLLPCPCTQILGFKKEASDLLHAAAKSSLIPIISKPADAADKLDDDAYAYYSAVMRSDRIYNMLVYNKYGTRLKDGCLISPVII